MAAQPWYTTREQLKRLIDSAETARNNRRIDRAISSASRQLELSLCFRTLYPRLGTIKFDWPNQQLAVPYRLWFDENDVISLTSLTSGGTAIDPANYHLEPVNSGPPYTYLELDVGSVAAFTVGSTWQQSIAALGWLGWRDDQEPAGTLVEGLDTSETEVNVSDSAAVGIGDLVKVDAERMIVTGKRLLDTGQNLQTSLTALTSNDGVAVTDGTLFAVDEVITIGTERMLIVDIAGNTLVVQRGWDGSTLTTHTAPTADIYAPRTLVVERGSVGSTAANHDTATAITRWLPPPLAQRLVEAEALIEMGLTSAGYARVVSSGAGAREPGGNTIEDLRKQVRRAHGRRMRTLAV